MRLNPIASVILIVKILSYNANYQIKAIHEYSDGSESDEKQVMWAMSRIILVMIQFPQISFNITLLQLNILESLQDTSNKNNLKNSLKNMWQSLSVQKSLQ